MKRFALSVLVPAAFCLGGCSRAPVSYAPPPQTRFIPPERLPLQVLNMNDPDAEQYFVRDIDSDLGARLWRWTRERPELRFWVKPSSGVKVTVDFLMANATLKDTGPATVVILVNRQVAGKVRCAKEGSYHFEQPVPGSWMKPGEANSLGFEVTPLWKKQPGDKGLGVMLVRAGFKA